MARRKKIPYRPDGYLRHAGAVAALISSRGLWAGAVLALSGVALVVVAFVAMRSAGAEETALAAYDEARGDARKLEAWLEEHWSSALRPDVLMSLASELARAPTDGDGKPVKEDDASRERRLAKAERALRELADGHPRFSRRIPAMILLAQVIEEAAAKAPRRYEEAAAVLERALGLEPGELAFPIQYHLGRVWWLAGREDRARKALQVATSGRAGVSGVFPRERKAQWREDAEYLLARIGTGAPKVSLDPVGPPPGGAGPAGP